MSFLRKKSFSSRVIASKTLPSKIKREAAALISEETDDGREIIRTMVNIMQDKVEGCTVAARVSAAQWLGAMMWGKPVDRSVQLNMSSSVEVLPSMSDDQLEEILRGGLSNAPGLRGDNTSHTSGALLESGGHTDAGALAVPDLSPSSLQPVRLGVHEGTSSEAEVEDGPDDGETIPDPDDRGDDGI